MSDIEYSTWDDEWDPIGNSPDPLEDSVPKVAEPAKKVTKEKDKPKTKITLEQMFFGKLK